MRDSVDIDQFTIEINAMEAKLLLFPLCSRSRRVENSGNKLFFVSNKGLIIGGEDTCQGDSGGPLWVEEGGKQYSPLSLVEVRRCSALIGR